MVAMRAPSVRSSFAAARGPSKGIDYDAPRLGRGPDERQEGNGDISASIAVPRTSDEGICPIMQETCHTPRTWLAKRCAVFLPHIWMGRAWQRMTEMGLDLGSKSVRRTALCGCPAEGARFGLGLGWENSPETGAS